MLEFETYHCNVLCGRYDKPLPWRTWYFYPRPCGKYSDRRDKRLLASFKESKLFSETVNNEHYSSTVVTTTAVKEGVYTG